MCQKGSFKCGTNMTRLVEVHYTVFCRNRFPRAVTDSCITSAVIGKPTTQWTTNVILLQTRNPGVIPMAGLTIDSHCLRLDGNEVGKKRKAIHGLKSTMW
ncbi:hypothetical protein J6590_015664 [Homalodisca vitripennis]|nr:hypothetical protein J6590_015664 [Homalodisca vitripennis]